ncbi:non-homologous end-joining DNA ligase [Plantactinospora sp. BB1]|uniref:non-homologous end-joining DNA ligase n=1 Tax=Plantactinospora sp. BB1 TaxID=2071627 RepID=UPI000D17A679|nr:non-homologous end-joining DNA ligase [Plantactinospora sp. BB1]AVT41897.1 DNA ligase [Plantactinospora sp. BB1]
MPGTPVKPMLAVTGELPAGPGWVHEFKWDGVRAVSDFAGDELRLYARSGVQITAAYPELAPLGAQLAQRGLADAVLDGEVVVLTEQGQPSFTALAERMHVREPARAARLAVSLPVTYMIFDLLRRDGTDLTGWPYQRRREALESLGLAGPRWAVPPVFPDGRATYQAAGEHGLEGVVSKRVDAVYRAGVRSPDWVKVKLEVTDDFVVGGWRPGVRRIGGLLVGVPAPDGGLVYRGRVGGGIGAAIERELLAVLEPLRNGTSPFVTPVPREDARGAIWVTPQIVVEVKYGQRTPDGRLRFPRIRRLRTDKTVADVDGA